MRVIILFALLATGCKAGDPDDPLQGTAQEGESCATLGDCEGDLVCLSVGEAGGVCSFRCDIDVNACGGSTECGALGSVGVDVCQPPESIPTADNQPAEEERTSLPCTSDAECQELAPNAVCGTWRGWSECTLTCANDNACNLPPVGGVTLSFMACDADEGDTARDICIPNEECFTNPMSCVDFGLPF